MSREFTILVGTMTGTAEMVADEMADKLDELGHEAKSLRMERANIDTFRRPGVIIVCTSTYGDGDVPDNAKKLYQSLLDEKPDLSDVRYCVFGLGDNEHHHTTFCFGSKRFDDILQELGAARIGEVVRHDSSTPDYPEEKGVEALEQWLNELDGD